MPKTAPSGAKHKVMVYLPLALRRAIGVLAAESGRRISDVHAEALGEYLRSHLTSPETDGSAEPRGSDHVVPAVLGQEPGSLDRILKRLDGQAQMLVAIQADTTSLVPAVDTRALAIVITALVQSGQAGLDGPDVRALLNEHGFRNLRTTTVRDALVQAGVARCLDGRWIGLDPRSSVDLHAGRV